MLEQLEVDEELSDDCVGLLLELIERGDLRIILLLGLGLPRMLFLPFLWVLGALYSR